MKLRCILGLHKGKWGELQEFQAVISYPFHPEVQPFEKTVRKQYLKCTLCGAISERAVKGIWFKS